MHLRRGLPVVRFVVISNLTLIKHLFLPSAVLSAFHKLTVLTRRLRKWSLVPKTKYNYDILSYFITSTFICYQGSAAVIFGQKNMNLISFRRNISQPSWRGEMLRPL